MAEVDIFLNSKEKENAVFLWEILSSSDDSDEEEYYLLCLKDKKSWPKIKNFVGDVINKLDDDQFRKYFRMKRTTAVILIEKFQHSEHFPNNEGHGGRLAISPERHIYSFLWFAVNKSTIQDVAQRFDMSESSLHRVINRVTGFLLDLGPDMIKLPITEADKNKFDSEFKEISGFPGVIGCSDGTSISIRTPRHKLKTTYVNRHDLPSITLQGICDYKKRFIDIFTGVPGKIHDARVFKLSDVSKTLPDICGNKYHILGDGAYFIRPWLLTPYKDYGRLTNDQTTYNKRFCATRVYIENTFGILKGRFRQLLRLDMLTVPTATKFIIACCILHNFCIFSDDLLLDTEAIFEDNLSEDVEGETEWQLRRQGEQKRDLIKNSFRYV